MRPNLLFSLLLLIICSLPVGAAAAADLQAVMKALESPFKSTASSTAIRDFQAGFTQESRLASLDRVQRGAGKVSFKFLFPGDSPVPAAMFRWDYRQPSEQQILSDGLTLWFYQPENRQVIESDLSQIRDQGENPISFLGSLGNLSRDFKVDWAEPALDERGNYRLNLRPRKPSQMIRSLLLVVSLPAVEAQTSSEGPPVFPVLSTMVTDPNGNRTRIIFENTQVNQQLPKHFFQFNRPEGVDLVTPGGTGGG